MAGGQSSGNAAGTEPHPQCIWNVILIIYTYIMGLPRHCRSTRSIYIYIYILLNSYIYIYIYIYIYYSTLVYRFVRVE